MGFQQKFYNILKNIFVGTEVKGKGGYINLMRIKHSYYRQFERQFNELIDTELFKLAGDSQVLKEEFFSKLYTFFNKYFSESGSIYFANTAFHEKVYEQIYTNDKDVMLFWKTKDLYYVKTEKLYRDLEIPIKQGEEKTYNFFISVAELTLKSANEKKEIVFHLERIDADGRIILAAAYASNGSKSKIADIHKLVKKMHPKISIETIEQAFAIFNRQTEVDYFIHKNAKGFLEQQFLHWYKSYLLDDDSDFDANRLNQLKALRRVAFRLIALVAQFEEELVKIWNKPKFVRNANYVITLDKIADRNKDVIQMIIEHENLPLQIKEWQDLGMVDADFKPEHITQQAQLDFSQSGLNQRFQHLPIDTQYFKNIELDLLALFNNLDEDLDGWLIHSENYQALNTIAPKFQGKVQAIYIDPPFNTGDDFDYVDRFQDATWLTLMLNRIEKSKNILKNNGTFYLHLDDNASQFGKDLLSQTLGFYVSEVIWKRSTARGNVLQGLSVAHDYLYIYSKSKDILWHPPKLPYSEDYKSRFTKKDKDGRLYSLDSLISPNPDRPNLDYEWNGVRKVWRVTKDKMANLEKIGRIEYTSNGVARYKRFLDELTGKPLTTIWEDIFPVNSQAKERINFGTQKPESLIQRVIECSTDERQIVLDYHLGSGTTASTAHKMNRKWIGIEMGEYLLSKTLNRLKETVSNNSHREPCGISKEVNYKGGGFFKYYALEQYEEALSKTVYTDKLPTSGQDIFKQYVFLKDDKLSAALEKGAEAVTVDLDRLYSGVDVAETLSNLYGKAIKRITKTEVVFADDSVIDLENLDYRHIKPLIWW